MVKLGKILIKNSVKVYEEDGEEITETNNRLVKDGVILVDQFGPIGLSEGLSELGIEHDKEFTYEKN